MSFANWFYTWLGIDASALTYAFRPLVAFVGLFVVCVGAVFILRIVCKICDMVLGR